VNVVWRLRGGALDFECEPLEATAVSGTIQRARDASDFTRRMAEEVRVGLQARPLSKLPSKYLYDDRGSALFDEITRLPEYYQTRTELAILETIADGVVEAPRELCELGSGVGRDETTYGSIALAALAALGLATLAMASPTRGSSRSSAW
jgi:uncharacterized SAM-dependent methyltransferase